MSGHPYRYASDVANYRQEYMKSLNLRSSIDVMNYQANKNYKETGALPPHTQMKDNRDTSDILLDTEKLKLSIVADFKPVAGPNMAMAIIQRVQASPLNGDGSFFIWLAQNAPELVMQLKRKYKMGIAGDVNDVTTMVLFLQSLYSKTKELNSSVKSAFDRPVSSGVSNLSSGDYTNIRNQFDSIYLKLISTRPLTPILKEIKERLDAMKKIFTPADTYTKIQETYMVLSNVSPANPGYMTVLNSGGYKEWIDYNERLPSPTEVNAVLSQLEKSEVNANATLSMRLLQNLSSLLPPAEKSIAIELKSQQLMSLVNPGGVASVPAVGTLAAQNTTPAPGTPAAAYLGGVVAEVILRQIWILYDANKDATDNQFDFKTPIVQTITSNYTQLRLNNITASPQSLGQAIDDYTQSNLNTVGQLINGEDSATFVARETDTMKGLMRQNGMIGFGLKKRRGRPKGSGLVKPITERIDSTKGVKQGSTQIPFGKYIINKNKLDKDIFYILDAKKGYCVKGYPQKKISKALGSVVRNIIGGSVPKFEELQNLDDDDKEYLHAVASKAGVLDKLSIPSPKKDKVEKDIHEFEVMKGEIMAGNDSRELIKKFKMVLLRLSKNGSIPKRESHEIMEDLINLGY